MQLIKSKTQLREGGFTLVELALVLAITGVVIGSSIKFAIPLMETANHLSTTEKMRKVEAALSLYAIQNYRIPCPAVPVTTTSNPFTDGFGFEQNNGTAQPAVASRCGNNAASWRGIVPFKTLGLPEDFVKDAWGSYFTYAVSPAFTLSSPAGSTSVHARCRTREWFYKANENPIGYINRNAPKAAFCCPGNGIMNSASNLIVRYNNGDDVLASSRNTMLASAAAASEVTYLDVTNPNSYLLPDETPVGIVYVLVSHGKNGGGTAFNGTADSRGVIPASSTSPCETENANDATGDRIYRDCELSEDTATNANDDFTLWRTQDMMFASEGQSCATP